MRSGRRKRRHRHIRLLCSQMAAVCEAATSAARTKRQDRRQLGSLMGVRHIRRLAGRRGTITRSPAGGRRRRAGHACSTRTGTASWGATGTRRSSGYIGETSRSTHSGRRAAISARRHLAVVFGQDSPTVVGVAGLLETTNRPQ